ncbi:hypothetical protein GCM10010400_12480 [Streptomyces aculeolatus]
MFLNPRRDPGGGEPAGGGGLLPGPAEVRGERATATPVGTDGIGTDLARTRLRGCGCPPAWLHSRRGSYGITAMPQNIRVAGPAAKDGRPGDGYVGC